MASWSELKSSCRSLFFSAEYDSGPIKEHGRVQWWRLQRVSLSPEEAGLCGCWQFIAVWRQREYLRRGKVIKSEEEYSFYATSLLAQDHSAQGLLEFIRGHWAASENGSHYRRDKSLGEDASLVRCPRAAHCLAILRNLVLGLFELQKDQGKADASYVPGWRRRMKTTEAIQLITKGV